MAEHEFAELIFFIAILIVLGAAIFNAAFRPAEIIRGIVTWLAVIMILVSVYTYRMEIAGFGGRILAALAPGLPMSGKSAGVGDAMAVVVVRTPEGHFSVRAMVEKRPVSFLVDTGASFVTLTTEDAAAIGLDPAHLAFTLPIKTANGPTHAASIVIDRLSVGSIERRKVSALVAPKGALEQSLLGMSFLDTLTGYAISGDRLVMSP